MNPLPDVFWSVVQVKLVASPHAQNTVSPPKLVASVCVRTVVQPAGAVKEGTVVRDAPVPPRTAIRRSPVWAVPGVDSVTLVVFENVTFPLTPLKEIAIGRLVVEQVQDHFV